MTKYLVLIYGDEQAWAQAPPQWHEGNAQAHEAFNAFAGAAVIGGHELEPSAKATTLRTDSAGRLAVTDGPFLETKEAIGGYYLLEAGDRDEAIRLAGQIPEASAPMSAVEIRPVKDPG